MLLITKMRNQSAMLVRGTRWINMDLGFLLPVGLGINRFNLASCNNNTRLVIFPVQNQWRKTAYLLDEPFILLTGWQFSAKQKQKIGLKY